jgi:ribosomal protein L12E/L44/L45/RPP1/RPP2
MNARYFAALLLLPLLLAAAPARPTSGDAVRQQHKAAAQKYFDSLARGVKLTGTISENGSPGRFTAIYAGGEWVVRQEFGDLVGMNYDGPRGQWSGSNYSLPYENDAAGNPASACLNLLTGGKYLEEPHWSRFTYVDDTAGGFNFLFTPEGLPSAEVVLYDDPGAPEHLQIMSVTLRLSPSDPDSNTYRSFYYYKQAADGNLYTARETGREIDARGETSSFSEFTVEKVEPASSIPADQMFNFERKAPAAATLAAPVDIPVDVGSGYFIIPLTFPGSDRTWTFIFDSGASASLFTPEAAAAAGLQASVNVPAHGHGGRVDFQMGLVKSASVGRHDAAPSQRVPLAPFPCARVNETNTDVLKAFESYGVGGILGVAILHQYVATFDNFESKVTFIPQTQFDGASLPRPNLELWLDTEDLIYFTGYISDNARAEPLRGQVVLDTGLQQKLSILEETVNATGLQFEKVRSRNNTVLSGLKKFDYVKIPRFDVAVLTWNDVEAALTSDDKGTLSARGLIGFVGVPFFYGTRVTIDLFNQRMYVRQLDEDEMQQLMEKVKTSMGLSAGDVPAVAADAPAAMADADDEDSQAESEDTSTESTEGRSKEDVDRDRFKDLDLPDAAPAEDEDE